MGGDERIHFPVTAPRFLAVEPRRAVFAERGTRAQRRLRAIADGANARFTCPYRGCEMIVSALA